MERAGVLLGRQTKKYLSGDSTSIPAETAQELLRSLLFTLRLALSEAGRPDRDLLTCGLEELLEQGRLILQQRSAEAKRLWERACLTAPQIPNVYYSETLSGFGLFFRSMDLLYFAHRVPCHIDYPLCVPVSDEEQGVCYAGQWLRRLLTENWLLSRFPQEAAIRLLTEEVPDYWNFPINLCEQSAVNAVGLALLGRPAGSLELSDGDCRKLSALLCGCGDPGAELDNAALRAAGELRAPKEAEDYLRAVMDRARPRLLSALQAGNIRRFFLP